MSDRQRRSRDERLVDQAYRSEGLAPFLMHEDVQKFFEDYEAKCVTTIAQADLNDVDAMRGQTLKLQAMRALKKDMHEIIAAGENAKKRLEELEANE